MVFRATALLVCIASVFRCAHAQTSSPVASPVEETIAKLIAATDAITTKANRFEKQRPHPLVEQLPAETASAILARLSGKLTDDPLRDTYIRYHLLHVVLKDANTRKDLVGKRFSELMNALPPGIEYERKPDERAEPEAIYRKYVSLVNACYVTTGYPPFQKDVGPPESFQFMDPARRRECEAKWAEAQTLKGQFKIINDADAGIYNDRMQWLKWMVQQVRGECLYGMLMCGEPTALDTALSLLTANASKDPATTAQLLTFFNAANFDGWLGQYPKPKLKLAAAALKTAVISADRSADPATAKEGKNRRRNLSELAFTLITQMETGTVPTREQILQLTRRAAKLPKLEPRHITPQTVNLDVINDAIERASAALEKMRPPDTDLGPLSYIAVLGSDDLEFRLPGHHGLAAWSMLIAGESPQAYWMQKRIGWLASVESISTYDRAMRLGVLGRLPLKLWDPWIRRDVDWLIANMTDQGNFNETASPTHAKGFGDNANGQYAALGFWAAEQAGYRIDEKVWKKIDQYWRDAQFPGENDKGAGWATRSYKALTATDDRSDFANRVSAPMTAAGVLTLSVTERYLHGPKMTGVGNKTSPAVANGLKWLDNNFAVTAVGADADLYYYLWTIQNVGQATGYRTFNKVDWFREATAHLLNQQSPDGSWKGPKGPIVSTSFALMYLSRARGPLAICKVRFNAEDPKAGGWNNRPNDMVNFTDYVSKQFEVPTSWQIADLDQPVYELIESATLYLATDKPFTLKDQQVARLREYIDAGGLLILAPEGNNLSTVTKSMRALAAQLYPRNELRRLEAKHSFYSLFQKIPETVPLTVVENSVRPLVVIVEKDISRELQVNSPKARDAFNLLTNIYLYASGRDSKRTRIHSSYVISPIGKELKTSLHAARIRFDGEFDPEPMALPQLQVVLAKDHGIRLDVSQLKPTELTNQKIAFLTATAGAKLPVEQSAALRKWIDAGGTLWIDTAAGNPTAAMVADALFASLGYELGALVPLDNKPDGPFSYRPHPERPDIRVILSNGRPAVYFTYGDIMSGLAGINHWNIAGRSVISSRSLITASSLSLQTAK